MLAAQRSYPPELAGRWELPGGKVEDGEDSRTALARELREELGLTVRMGPLVPASGGALDEATRQKWRELYAEGGRYADQVDGDFSANMDDGSRDWPLVGELRMRVWVCELEPAGTPELTSRDGGHQRLEWVPWGRIEDLNWLPADYPIIAGIRAQLGV